MRAPVPVVQQRPREQALGPEQEQEQHPKLNPRLISNLLVAGLIGPPAQQLSTEHPKS
jgi:hypothetical protein